MPAYHRGRPGLWRGGWCGVWLMVTLCSLVSCSTTGSAPLAADGPGPIGPIGTNVLFVAIQDDAEVAIVDMDRLEVTEVIRLTELGFGSRAMPHDVVVSPDGGHWFVSLIGEHRVLRFDREHRYVGSFEMETPGMLGLDPTGAVLLVSRSMSAVNPPTRLGFVQTADLEAHEVDVVFPRPHGIVIHRDGGYAYTASLGVNQIASIDVESERVELVNVAGPTHAFVQLAISPDGGTLVASGELSGDLVVFDLADPARPKLLTSVDIGPRAFDPLFHPDGRTVWIPIKGADEIAVVETTGWTVIDRIAGEGLAQPHTLRFSVDGTRAFVTNNAAAGGEASLVVVDTTTREVEAAIELGRNLTGLGTRTVQ